MTSYYVNTGGSDSNPGTISQPWQTITHVNAQTFNAGDQIFFQGGQTFTGPLTIGGTGCTCNGTAGNPVTFDSYGGGRATISTTGAVNAILATNTGNLTINDLICVGDNSNSDGVLVQNTDTTTNNKIPNVILYNLDVSNYGANGIRLLGGTGASNAAGFTTSTISACVTHSCTGNCTVATSGIATHGQYGQGITNPTHTNITITGCTAHNNTGTSSFTTNWSGSGIFLAQASNSLITLGVAYNNGVNSSSHDPVGIWCSDCLNCIIQFCESYGNLTLCDGFDMDGGCENCIIQYCYAHNNSGCGFLLYAYNDGTVTTWQNNTVRFCIGQNNGAAGSGNNIGDLAIQSDSVMVSANAYNNTFYDNANVVVFIRTGTASTITGVIANNIFYADGVHLVNSSTIAIPAFQYLANDYYTTGSFSIAWNGTTYTSFASWQTASGQEIGGTVFNAPALGATSTGNQGFTSREVLQPWVLGPASGQITVTFSISSTTSAATLVAAWIGEQGTGTPYSFDGNQVQLKFSGSASKGPLTGAQTFTSDPVTLTYSQSKSLVIAHYWTGTEVDFPASGISGAIGVQTGVDRYEISGNDASTTAATGYSHANMGNPQIQSITRVASALNVANVGLTSNPALNNPGGGRTIGGYAPPAPQAYQFPSTSPMIGAGLNLSQVFDINMGTQDYYGDPVTDYNANYDIGAYVWPGPPTVPNLPLGLASCEW